MDNDTRQILDSYQWAVGKLSQDFYDTPYSELPKWAKVDVQAGAKQYTRGVMDKVLDKNEEK